MRPRVLVRHPRHVDQQPGITTAQLHLRGTEHAEQEVPDDPVDRKRPQPPCILSGIVGGPLAALPGIVIPGIIVAGVTRPSSAHDCTPPASSDNRAEMLLAPIARCPGVSRSAATF